MKQIILGGTALIAIGAVNVANAGEFTVMVGGGVAVAPDYEGSDDYDGGLIPGLEVAYERDIQPPAQGTDIHVGLQDASLGLEGLDLGVMRLYRPEGMYRLGLGVGYGGGRDQDDNNDLNGMGDIDGHALGRLSLDYVSPDEDWNGGLQLSQDLSNETSGATVTGYLGYNFPLAENVILSTTGNIVWADDDYMQSYFGVSDRQASNSSYSRYDAGSGIKSVGLELGVNWMMTESWAVMGSLGYSRLTSDAADSPLVDQKGDPNQFLSMVAVVYTF